MALNVVCCEAAIRLELRCQFNRSTQLNERPRKAFGIETQQKDLTQVLRRPVETTRVKRT